MKLPNHHNVIIPVSKLREYCLNPDHRTGKHKAKLFEAILGFKQKDYQKLNTLIKDGLSKSEAILKNQDRFGKRYFVDISLNRINSHILRTAWIIKNDESVPRLITCYLLQTS